MNLSIPEMNCGHCRASVTEALTRLDPRARIEVDLTTRTARLATTATPAAVVAALAAAGFDASAT